MIFRKLQVISLFLWDKFNDFLGPDSKDIKSIHFTPWITFRMSSQEQDLHEGRKCLLSPD